MVKIIATLMVALEQIFDAWFSDDEPYDAEWMDAEAWRKTRI